MRESLTLSRHDCHARVTLSQLRLVARHQGCRNGHTKPGLVLYHVGLTPAAAGVGTQVAHEWPFPGVREKKLQRFDSIARVVVLLCSHAGFAVPTYDPIDRVLALLCR